MARMVEAQFFQLGTDSHPGDDASTRELVPERSIAEPDRCGAGLLVRHPQQPFDRSEGFGMLFQAGCVIGDHRAQRIVFHGPLERILRCGFSRR
jgi:hypothetical protein